MFRVVYLSYITIKIITKFSTQMYNSIKQIPIRSYLEKIGCKKQNKNQHYGLYLAFWRGDTKPSIRVDFTKNLWIDFATKVGGSIIDLVMTIDNCTFNEAVEKLRTDYDHTTATATDYTTTTLNRSSFDNLRDYPLANRNLLDYLYSRAIDLAIAKQFCREVRYTVGGKDYYAIGFKNDKGGYVIRSKYFKGCSSSHPTTIKGEQDSATLFEGFMDFLSFVTLYRAPKGDTIVLNSTSNIDQCDLAPYAKIYLLLDNDTEGDRATAEIIAKHPNRAEDHRKIYKGAKDINEHLTQQRK